MSDEFFQEQDLGDMHQTIRSPDQIHNLGNAQMLFPDRDKSHGEAQEAFRKVLDEYYGDAIADIEEPGQRAVVTRLTVRADDLPVIEYSLVDE